MLYFDLQAIFHHLSAIWKQNDRWVREVLDSALHQNANRGNIFKRNVVLSFHYSARELSLPNTFFKTLCFFPL